MAGKKISELTPLGAAFAGTDLLEISDDAGDGSYSSKSITGANIAAGVLATDPAAFTGAVTVGTNLTVSGQGFVALHAHGTVTGAWAVDWDDSNIQSVTLNVATSTMSATNPETGGTYILVITQGATPCVVTWPAAFKWPAGTAPTLSLVTGEIDVITLVYDGTNYYGVGSINFS